VFALFISQMIEQIHETETERKSAMVRPSRRVSLSDFFIGVARESNSAFGDVYETQETLKIDNPLRPDIAPDIAISGNIEMKTKRISDTGSVSDITIEEKYVIAVSSCKTLFV